MDPTPHRCSVSGIPLRPSRSSADSCGSPFCRRLRRQRGLPAPEPEDDVAARRVEAERRSAIERILLERERDLRAQLPAKVLRARLPANERPILPLPEGRRATFAVNLSAALDRAMDDPDRPVPETPESPTEAAPLVRASCAACRGSCCASGGDHAYLYPDHFRRFLRRHPGKTKEDFLRDYLSRLPAASTQESCVYHAETGCALPRELRSNLCNTFLCGDLEDLLGAQPAEGGPVPVLAVCFRDRSADPVRTALLDGHGNATSIGST
jgi:hypothetical protein